MEEISNYSIICGSFEMAYNDLLDRLSIASNQVIDTNATLHMLNGHGERIGTLDADRWEKVSPLLASDINLHIVL